MRTPPLSSREKAIVVFASVHLTFLLFGMLPISWRDQIHVSPMFRCYERITRCHQLWNMFETIPNMNSLRTGRYTSKAELTLEVIPAYIRSLKGVHTLKEIAVERPSVLGPFPLGALVANNAPAPSAP